MTRYHFQGAGRLVVACVATMILMGCTALGRGGSTPPSNINDACEILKDKGSWRKPLQRTEAEWGVPASLVLAIIHQESRFRAIIRPPKKHRFTPKKVSSSRGYTQAIDATWDAYEKERRNKLTRLLKTRAQFGSSADFVGWYIHGAARSCSQLTSPYDAKLAYFLYHNGAGACSRFFQPREKGSRDYNVAVIADKVQARARLYQTQLSGCQKYTSKLDHKPRL